MPYLGEPAWAFVLGRTSQSASAADLAGNSGTGSTTFTATVTCRSLTNLVRRFATNAAPARALAAKIDSI